MNLFWHDLRRLARRGHPALGRTVFVTVLMIALVSSFLKCFPNASISDLTSTLDGDRQRVFGFGRQFVQAINLLQLIALAILTPVVCGGALAEERVCGTLDLLRISRISSAAIVTGKFAARVFYLGSFLLICLPIFAFSQLWGEFEPSLVAGSFIINVLTLSVLVAVSLLCSSVTKSAPAGVAATYGCVFVLYAVARFVPAANPATIFAQWPRGGVVTYWGFVLAYSFICVPLTAVSLYAASKHLARDGDEPRRGFVPMSGSRAAPPAALDARLLTPIDSTPYSILSLPVSSFFPRAASIRIFPAPRVRDHPMIWKELYFGGTAVVSESIRTLALTVIIGEVLLCGYLLITLSQYPEVPPGMVREWNRILRPIVLTAVIGAMLSVTTFAAGAITLERERKTLDALLALPDGRMAVFLTKWAGSLLRVRWPIAAIILPLAAGVTIGAFHALTVGTLAIALIIHLALAASLGITCSVLAHSTVRSMLLAMLAVLVVVLVPLLLASGHRDFFGASAMQRGFDALGVGLSPFATWMTLLLPDAASSPRAAALQVVPGLSLYVLAVVILAGSASWIFVRLSPLAVRQQSRC